MSANTTAVKFFRRELALAAAVGAIALSGATLPAAPPAPTPPKVWTAAPSSDPVAARHDGVTFGAGAAPKGEGLASLDDRVVASELSSRGITNLLDRYFKLNGISEADQESIKTVGALRELINPKLNIPYGEKVRRVRQIAKGIDTIIPTIRDPEQMMTVAAIVIEFGVSSDVNSLEYWGEDPVTQAQLKPMTTAVLKLLDGASKLAQAQADEMAPKLHGANDPNGARWQRLDDLAHTAAYNRDMSVYFDALATSPKDPARKTMAEAAITGLKEFDNADSGVQPRIKNMIGKLNMVSGNYAEAKKSFGAIIAVNKEIVPAPNPFEQYDARYFTVVSEIMAKDLAAAQADKAELDKWETGTFPALLKGIMQPAAIAAQMKGVSAAGQMLQWRVHVLEGELAKANPAAKKKADDAAEAVLLKLRIDRPDLAARIDQQLVNSMPANKKIDDAMPPSLLLALLKKGMNESYKFDPDKPDPVILNKGIEAANAIIHRKDRKDLTQQNVIDAQLAIAHLQDRLGEKVAAINSYLDFATTYFKTDAQKATESLDRAGFLVYDLKKQPLPPAGYADAFNRFQPIAINPPFRHVDMAADYAEQLLKEKQYTEALKYFRMIPRTTPAAAAYAQYKEMIVLHEILKNTNQDPIARKQTVTEMTAVADAVRKLGADAKDDIARIHACRATLLESGLASTEQKDPKKVLEVLTGFDQLVNAISNGTTKEEIAARSAMKAEFLRTALVDRINSYIAVGQIAQAVQELQKLLEKSSGGDGIGLVRELLGKLDEEYVHADIIHDTKSMREIAADEALLTGHLVDWSKPPKQTNP
ncbi:MAG TPA: hypothetical protein VFE47_03910, partial [Tepidisphaeraceae bacterium]|nr:hypothetical protein [Tepidisphaeraceae bacterium]